MIFVLSSISSNLEFWSVSHTSIYKNSESNVFKKLNFLGEISNNWVSNLLGINAYKTLESIDNPCWQY